MAGAAGVKTNRPSTFDLTVIAAATLIGLTLRILGARGDLWLDEIWTLKLLEHVGSPGEIFWNLAHDNNHPLNSLYLYFVGADASALAQRGFSILLGTLTIPAAALANWRRGRIAALVAAGLFAIAYPMVHYGSEARGYAGLILFTLLAIYFAERTALRGDGRGRIWVALSIAIGVLCQPLMLASGAVAIAGMGWIVWRAGAGLKAAELEVRRTALLTAIAILPIAVAFLVASRRAGGTQMGGLAPFRPGFIFSGYGDLLNLQLGLHQLAAAGVALGVAAAAIAAYLAIQRSTREDRIGLYLIETVLLPAAMYLAQLPNLQFPRYFLPSGAIFLLLLADLAAFVWRRSPAWRPGAIAATLIIVIGNAVEVSKFMNYGRGHYADAVQAMAVEGPIDYSSNHDFRNTTVVDFFAHRQGVATTYIPAADLCTKLPHWVLIGDFDGVRGTLPAACAGRYASVSEYPSWGLSGWSWTLYRRML